MIGPVGAVPTPSAGNERLRVLLAVEQLRRELPGGIGRYAVGLLDGLRDLESAEPVATRSSPLLSLLVSRAPGIGGAREDPLAPWGLPIRTSRLPSRLLTRAWDRGLAVAPSGFDVVHAVSLAFPPVRHEVGPAGRPIPALSVIVHDVAWRLFPEATTSRGRSWHEAALRRALERADALIVPSEPVADELRKLGGRGPITVVPLGSDHLPAPDDVTTQALLRRYGITGGYLLTAGTLEPRKNLDRLFAAYRTARPSMPEPWPLVVVGPKGWGGSAPGPPPTTSGLPNGVIPVGQVSDGVLAGLYAGARLFAYVPLTEGYGLPPVEAMTFGVPVLVSTGVPSAEVSAGAPQAAVRVDPLDVDAMAQGLLAAATDEALRAELIAAGTQLAAGRTWAEVARGTVAVWRSLS
jgi:glycosyltransferase involved in cell wall biosynthesis